MNTTLKHYLLHLLTVVLVAVGTAIVSGPLIPVTGGAIITVLVRELLAQTEK